MLFHLDLSIRFLAAPTGARLERVLANHGMTMLDAIRYHAGFPDIIGELPLQNFWCYKYESGQPGAIFRPRLKLMPCTLDCAVSHWMMALEWILPFHFSWCFHFS